jgi:hypothetical protein
MIVVIAGRNDRTAKGLVARWQAREAMLLTADDLSVRGWRFYSGASHAQIAIASGLQVAPGQIQGVLTRLPAVFACDLPHIIPEDRAYVAREMTAFLAAWISMLKCPVLNAPTPGCLSGPSWRPERWTRAAAQVGMSVRPLRRHVTLEAASLSPHSDPNPASVTILADRSFGSVDTELATQARRLAALARVDLATFHFSRPAAGSDFLGVDLWSGLEADGLQDAVLDYFLHRATQGATRLSGRSSGPELE